MATSARGAGAGFSICRIEREAMRGLVGLYIAIGIALVAIGFILPGPCPNRNTDIVSNVIFVLTWPVGLYSEVYKGHLSAEEWLRGQACEGGGKLGPKTIPG
jgi:hypothetical protein